MLLNMFANIAILVSFIFVGGQILKEEGLSFQSSLKTKIFVGIFMGILGLILMNYHVEVQDAYIDLRYFPIMIASYSAGVIPGMIATVMIGLGRLLFFSNGMNPTIIAMTGVFIVGINSIAFSYLYRKWSNNWKWTAITGQGILIGNIILYLFTADFLIITSMTLVFVFTSIVVYYSIKFVNDSNRLYRKFKKESSEDPLTGLNNKRVFNQLLEGYIKRDAKLALLVLDIDHFKEVNDVYGHLRGDFVLKQVGKLLIEASRSVDSISRHGGEEFTVLLPDCDKEQALKIAERMRQSIEDYKFEVEGLQIHVTVSIGVAIYSKAIAHPDQLFQAADEALYRAKDNGRNRIEI